MGFKNWGKLYKQGVLLNHFYNQLTKKRIEITPYYLFKEGIFNSEQEPVTTKLSPCETVLLKPPDFRILAARKDRDMSEEAMIEMYNYGNHCMGIKHKGEIVAYGWYEQKVNNNKYIKFQLKENEAYLSGARTLMKYRGNNLAPYLRYQMYLHLKEKGYKTFYSITMYDNIASLLFKRKLGGYPVKLYLYVFITNHFKRVFKLRSYRDKFPEMSETP